MGRGGEVLKERVKNEHYVPRSYLKYFANDKGQIHVYDRLRDRTFRTNITNIAAEKDFFTLPVTKDLDNYPFIKNLVEKINGNQLIEKFFSDGIEEDYKNLLDSIRNNYDMLLKLSNPDGKIAINSELKAKLSVYIIIQMLRTKRQREIFRETEEKFAQAIFDDQALNQIRGFEAGDVNILVPRSHPVGLQASMIFDPFTINQFANAINNHIWIVLINNSSSQPFYTSDNPVVRAEHVHDKFIRYGGLQSKGVEINIPIRSDLMISMYERNFHRNRLSSYENRFITLPDPENIKYLNWLQVTQSNQIYCEKSEFSLIEKMKKETPEVLKNNDIVELDFGGRHY